MYTVVFVNFLAVFFSLLESRGVFKKGLKISFFIIFIFLAFRYNYGNDYKAYLDGFIEINKYSTIDYFGSNFEPGWIVLCRLFSPVGFFGLIFFLALFNCFVYYNLIKKYVPRELYWFAVFLYTFNSGLMLTHISAIRQALGIGLFIFSIDYLMRKEFLKYIVVIIIAYLIHTSALILLPIVALTFVHFRMNMIGKYILPIIFILLAASGKLLAPLVSKIVSSNFDRYDFYQQASDVDSGLGLLMILFLMCLTVFYHNQQNAVGRHLFKIALLYFLIVPLGLALIMIGRVGMYFEPITIVVYPLIIFSIKSRISRYVILTLILFFTCYVFYQFFQSPIWRDSFKTYQTIFDAPIMY